MNCRCFVWMALGLACCVGCRQQKSGPEETGLVKVDTVRCHEGEFLVAYPGKVRAASDVNLAFRVPGPIQSIPVQVGQYVRKGEVIARIDPRDYRTQLAATEAEYTQIKTEAERVIELQKRGSATDNDRDKAYYGLQQIGAKYTAHQDALKDTELKAPFDGYIQKKFFDAGETVSAGMPVLAMIDARNSEVEIHLPASDYVRRDRFDSYTCEADAMPGKIFPLELIGVARKANLNQLYNVRFRLGTGLRGNLSSGMNVNVTIRYTPDAADLTEIPLTAVFEKDGGSAVWIYDSVSQTVISRPVKLAELRRDGVAVVSEGLKPGEIVVSAGVKSLTEGQSVRRVAPVSQTNIGGLL